MNSTLPLAMAGLTLLAAFAVDWLLRRLARRLPRAVLRRRGRQPTGPRVAGERALQLALLPVRFGVWLAAIDSASARFPDERTAFLMHFADGLWTPLFELRGRSYTTLDFVVFPAAMLVAWVLVRLFTHFFLRSLLASAGVEHGVREAITLLIRYALIAISTMALLQLWGFDVSNLALVASVLGVGIGFGLQNIANNFVSGLIISLERPIQLGDFIRVGEWVGTVERIGPRCVEISTNDRVSILVPNSRLLEGDVVNWSHGDPRARIHVPVGVSYGSSISRVRMALLDAARGLPTILSDPRPDVEFRGFGDSALNFELLVWTLDPRRQDRLTSDLNYRIEASLRKHGIEIPFPQRDLHLKSPQVEPLLRAWGVDLPDHDRSAEGSHAPLAMPTGHEEIDSSLAPRAWTPAQLDRVVEEMRGPDGVAIRDRRHLLSIHPKAFVGNEAVDWLADTFGLSRDEAVELGQILLEHGFFHHVLDEHPFRDEALFYRFRVDDRRISGPHD